MKRHLNVSIRDIGVEGIEGLYTERLQTPALALEQTLYSEGREALILEAESLLETAMMRFDGREYFFTPKSYETMCRRRIANLKKTIMYTRPEWVQDIYDACRAADNIHVAVGLAGLHLFPYPALAIIENLQEHGEISVTSGFFDEIRCGGYHRKTGDSGDRGDAG